VVVGLDNRGYGGIDEVVPPVFAGDIGGLAL